MALTVTKITPGKIVKGRFYPTKAKKAPAKRKKRKNAKKNSKRRRR
jgi:hypothetical protein